jgi:type III secretion system YscQ/HrcQ family protein
VSVDDETISELGPPHGAPGAGDAPPGGFGPLGPLPRVSLRQARLEAWLARAATGWRWLAGTGALLGDAIEVGRPDVIGRASGTRRAGAVAVLSWPRLGAQVGLGVETPVAHTAVDRLLGFERLPAESRAAVSPVEWGILTFLLAECLHRLADDGPGPLGAWDLLIDRVSPEPFEPADLGRFVTVRWPVTLAGAEGSVRLWVPEALTARWLSASAAAPPATGRAAPPELDSVWQAEAGTVHLSRGLRALRPGVVLPLTGSRLRGTPGSPTGPVALTSRLSGAGGRYTIPAEPVALSGGGRLTVTAPIRHDPTPREGLAVNPTRPNPSSEPTQAPAQTPAVDVPVTLVVELGRVNLTLGRLADLKPGEVLELGRHSREPVELTSGGRLVARGELVQIDTELGVRVTSVFL